MVDFLKKQKGHRLLARDPKIFGEKKFSHGLDCACG